MTLVENRYRDVFLPLLVVLVFSALWPRYQGYRLHRDIVAKARLCSKNLAIVGMACWDYQNDVAAFPQILSKIEPKGLGSELRCPFDGSRYRSDGVIMTPENVDNFPSGLVAAEVGCRGVIARCTSSMHAKLEPGLEPGYAFANFLQVPTELTRGSSW
jgi:hypothetical protein